MTPEARTPGRKPAGGSGGRAGPRRKGAGARGESGSGEEGGSVWASWSLTRPVTVGPRVPGRSFLGKGQRFP